jgi:hypothetical protein
MLARRKLGWWVMAAAMAAAVFGVTGGVTGVSAADPMVFDRGLPTAGLNNVGCVAPPICPARSNVSFAPDSNGPATMLGGDDFTIGTVGQTWVVTGIRTWTVGYGDPATFHLGNEYSDVSLYTGTSGVSLVETGTIPLGSDTNSNPDIVHTKATYVGGVPYEGLYGGTLALYQNDFNNLNLTVPGGVTYYFAVDGTPTSSTDLWFNHASNAALSGSTQQGADGVWQSWLESNRSLAPVACHPAAGTGRCDGGWDKPADINVQVFAHQLVLATATAVPPSPTPTTIPVVGGAVGGTTDLETGAAVAPSGAASHSNSSSVVPDAALPVALVAVAGLGVSGWYVRRRWARTSPRQHGETP